MNRIVLGAALLLLAPATALAGGFSISEVGSVEAGRGGAAAALADGPSQIYYNPANIARLDGLQVTVGASGLAPRFQYSGSNGAPTATSDAALSPPPHLALSYNLGDTGAGNLALGLGVFVPYGSTFSWPDNWAGRADIQKIALQVFEIAPTLAIKPSKLFALGIGFRYLPAQVYMKQAVLFGTAEEGQVELSGSGSGMGLQAGLAAMPIDGLSLGLSWRSASTLDFKGQSNFTFPAPFEAKAVDMDVTTSIPLAQVFRFGVGYEVTKELSLSADLEYQMWSAFKDLTIHFLNADGTENKAVASARNSTDGLVLHLGGQYKVSDSLAVRAGYAWDQHTIPEANVSSAPPDSDKHVVSLGLSYLFGSYGIHANFADVIMAKRITNTNAMPGTWQGGWAGGTMAYIFGLSLTANLDLGGSSKPASVTQAPAVSQSL